MQRPARSLPERLVVLVIIGILVLVALPNLMPLVSKAEPYNCYQVMKPIPVQSGTAAGSFWFASPGGGTQFFFPEHNIQYYIDNGYLSPL